MSPSRHRAAPTPRSALLPRRLSRRVSQGLVAAGVVTVLGTVGVVVLRPDAGPDRDGDRTALAATDALVADTSPRLEERTSRDRVRSVPTATPVVPSPTTASPTTPAPETAPEVVGQLWVAADVNVRSGPSADQARIGSLEPLTRAGVTGVVRNGWTQVVVDGRAGWVRSVFLSTSKPEPEATAPTGVSDAPCAISKAVETHLTANARLVYRAVCDAFGDTVSSFGGYRAGDDGDHGSGRAVDIMVSGDPGSDVARYVQAHAKALDVTYVIYQQKMWMAGDPSSDWELMEDRGSRTANHFDHVHVSVG